MATPGNDPAEMAKARADVYGLLADVFREEASEALLSKLAEPEFSGALKTLDLSLDEMFETTPIDKLVEDLAIEYTRLFIGPGSHISPHESMHMDARFGEKPSLWGEQTVAVKKFMKGAGVEVDHSFGGMPDHISAEFEFMQQLSRKEAEAWTARDDDLAGNIIKIEKRFFDEHLSKWVVNFCNEVIAAAELAFYKQFSQVTKGFIEFEEEILGDHIGKIEESDKLSA